MLQQVGNAELSRAPRVSHACRRCRYTSRLLDEMRRRWGRKERVVYLCYVDERSTAVECFAGIRFQKNVSVSSKYCGFKYDSKN